MRAILSHLADATDVGATDVGARTTSRSATKLRVPDDIALIGRLARAWPRSTQPNRITGSRNGVSGMPSRTNV